MSDKLFKSSQYLYWYHWVVISTSLILTVVAWRFAENQIQEKRSELFKIQTEQLLDHIAERMTHYEVALKAGAAAIQSLTQNVEPDNWAEFSKALNLIDIYPGINGIGVIYYVPQNKIDLFLQQQKKLRPNFRVHPAHNKNEYWPITYIEPLKSNNQAVGLDMAFESNRLSAAKLARDTATTQITAPIVLVQDTKKTPGFLKYIPFYNSTNIDTIEQRKKHFVGHVYAPFIMSKLVAGTLKQNNRQLVFSISDGTTSLYDELTFGNSHYDATPLFKKEVTLDMYGRPWTFNIQTAHSFRIATQSNQPLIILGSALVIDTMLLFILITLTRSQRTAVTIANKITQELSIKEEYYRNITNSAPCGILITNEQGEIEKTNPQTESLFNYSNQQLLGKKIDLLIPKKCQKLYSESDDNSTITLSKKSMDSGNEVFGITQSGKEFPAEIGFAQFLVDGKVKILVTVVDMSEYAKITEDLTRSNRELSDFAYVASHDLKAPLRGIMQLSSWIEEDITDYASVDTKKHLSLLMNRTARLEKLLEDLLDYSRIGRNTGDVKRINIKELVLSIFDLQYPSSDVRLICQDDLPEFETNVTPLEVIFRNLISNAIKHKGEGNLIITVSAKEFPTYYQFTVQDNGPGIPTEYHELIFDLFKTLLPRDEVEGSGMGLAIIKKLLDYQKCEINVTSDGKNGACFIFTWPK